MLINPFSCPNAVISKSCCTNFFPITISPISNSSLQLPADPTFIIPSTLKLSIKICVTLAAFTFPTLTDFTVSENLGKGVFGGDILRATFKDANGEEGEGIFSAYVYDVGTYYVYENIISGKQIDIQYLSVYDTIFITTPKDEFIDWEDTLNTICSSLSFTDTFINGFNQQQDAVMKNFQQIRAIGNEISDGIMDSWNKRNTSFDIMSQKQSDATLGYERVYDTKTNEIYKAYNGFNDEYDGERYKPVTDNMYLEKTSGYIEN